MHDTIPTPIIEKKQTAVELAIALREQKRLGEYKPPSSFALAILRGLQSKPVFGGVPFGVKVERRIKGKAAKKARKAQR